MQLDDFQAFVRSQIITESEITKPDMIIKITAIKLQGKMRSLGVFSVATNMEVMLQGKMISPQNEHQPIVF